MDIRIDYTDEAQRNGPYSLTLYDVEKEARHSIWYQSILLAQDDVAVHQAVLSFISSKYFTGQVDANWKPRDYLPDKASQDCDETDGNPIRLIAAIYFWCTNSVAYCELMMGEDDSKAILYEATTNSSERNCTILITFNDQEEILYKGAPFL